MKKFFVMFFLIFMVSCAADDSSYNTNNSNNYNNTSDYNNVNNINNSNNVNNTNNANNTNHGGNVNVGGVQDIGVYRGIVEDGGIPSLETLDENGFFSEHYLDYPFNSCGTELCMNGMIGRGRSVISDDYVNILQMVLKTFVDPDDHTRPPTDFIVVVDVSGSMFTDDKLELVKSGLQLMVDELTSEDRLAIISYSTFTNEILPLTYSSSDLEKQNMKNLISDLIPSGGTNIYGGLEKGFEVSAQSNEESRYARIILVSDGVPTSGITDEYSIVNLANENTSDKVQLTSIGVGSDINYNLMKNLALKGGNFYFIEDFNSLLDIFVEEVNFFASPIAKDIMIELTTGDGFYAGDSIGFDTWIKTANGGYAEFPNLYAVSRKSTSTENPHSRRGGGSALFVRLVLTDPERDLSGMLLTLTYTDPQSGETVTQQQNASELASGNYILPADEYYSQTVMRKSFLMMNIYLALEEVAIRTESYDFNGAYNLLTKAINMAQNSYLYEDDDIVNDILLMQQLLANIAPYVSEYPEEDDPCYNDPCCGDPCCGDPCCIYGDCGNDNYDDNYREQENVHYGCSSSNATDRTLPLLAFLIVALFFGIKRLSTQNR